MRPLLYSLLFAILAVPACTVWDPDYEPDPNTSLRDLLAPYTDRAAPMNAVERDRLRFAVERLATRHPGHVASQVAASALSFSSG